MLLLHTCSLVWLTDEWERFSRDALSALRDSDRRLFVSAISGFEIALKYTKRQLALPRPPADFYSESLRFHGVVELPLTGEIAIQAAELPSVHRDPRDRFIVATALAHGLPVLTPDPFIRRYPGVSVIW